MGSLKPREVAVAIPVEILPTASNSAPDPCSGVDLDRLRVYLVSSRKHENKWVLPKGGIEQGETARQAAIREMWEEAGLVLDPDIPSTPLANVALEIYDQKPHKHSPVKIPNEQDFVPRAKYTAMELIITTGSVKNDWPEKPERQRAVFTLKDAQEKLEWRQDLHTLFKTWVSNIPSAQHESS